MRLATKATLTLATSIAALTAVMGPASADPSFTPSTSDYVAVGSDTTQDVMNSLASKYNTANPGKPRIASYNATGTATIVPASGCASTTRPDGSGAGISALLADTTGCIDVARSSRGPKTGSGATFFAYGRDGVAWAKTATSNAPANLTTANLRAIYSCAPTARNWTAFGGASGTILPKLPQAASGTRAFFLTAIGVTTPGSCVQTGETATFQENQGGILGGSANALAPYSAAKWAAQAKGASTDRRAGAVLGKVNGTTAVVNGALNPSFSSTFSRTIYNVTKTSRVTTFRPVFGPSGYFCSTAGQSEVARFGFGKLSSTTAVRCGSETTGV